MFTDHSLTAGGTTLTGGVSLNSTELPRQDDFLMYFLAIYIIAPKVFTDTAIIPKIIDVSILYILTSTKYIFSL